MNTKAEDHASGSAGVPPADSRVSREPSDVVGGEFANDVLCAPDGRGEDASTGRRDARATRDTPDALPSPLAMMNVALSRRVINANYRLGTAECAARLAAIAANPVLAEVVRLDALEALAQWPVKLGRARVIGIVVEGDVRAVSDALVAVEAIDYVVLTAGSFDILVEVVAEDDEQLLSLLNDTIRATPGVRSTETFVYLRLAKQTYTWGTR